MSDSGTALDDTASEVDEGWYLATYPDVAASGLSAAAHYRLLGARMGRAPNASRAQTGSDAGETAPIATGAIIDAPADMATSVPPSGTLPPRPARIGGATLALPGSDGPDLARADTAADLAPLSGPLDLYCRLLGLERPTDAPTGTALCAGPGLRDGILPVKDIWFAADHRLRLMTELAPGNTLRAWQATSDAPAALQPIGGTVQPADGPGLCDLALADPLMPLLIEVSDSTGHTLATGLLPFPSLARGGLHHAELLVRLPLGPPEQALWTLSHGLLSEALDSDAPRSISAIEVDPTGATGAEPIFSPELQNWLALVFGLTIEVPGAQDADWLPGAPKTSTRTDGLTLTLPSAAIPTLAALTSRRLTCTGVAMAGPFLVSDVSDKRPRWSVAVPMADAELMTKVQPLGSPPPGPVLLGGTVGGETDGTMAPVHLSITFRDPPDGHIAQALLPHATDQAAPVLPGMTNDPLPALSVALTIGEEAGQTRAALGLLAAQSGLGPIRLILCPGAGCTPAVLEHAATLVPHALGAPVTLPPLPAAQPAQPLLDRIAQLTDAELILTLDDSTLLHDPRLLSGLVALLMAAPNVASTSALLVAEEAQGKTTRPVAAMGGMFPSHVSFLAAPQLIFAAPDCLHPLPDATYPVVANGAGLALIRRAAILETGSDRASGWHGRSPVPGVEALRFGLTTRAQGWTHLCTTALRATTTAVTAPGYDWMDPLGPSYILPARWDDLLGAVTQLRDLS